MEFIINYEIEFRTDQNLDLKENQKITDKIANLVNTILDIKSCHTEAFAEVSQNINNKDISLNAQNDKRINDLESQINDLVYKLYGLDSSEIQIIEN